MSKLLRRRRVRCILIGKRSSNASYPRMVSAMREIVFDGTEGTLRSFQSFIVRREEAHSLSTATFRIGPTAMWCTAPSDSLTPSIGRTLRLLARHFVGV